MLLAGKTFSVMIRFSRVQSYIHSSYPFNLDSSVERTVGRNAKRFRRFMRSVSPIYAKRIADLREAVPLIYAADRPSGIRPTWHS